jgi:hypothetical protein
LRAIRQIMAHQAIRAMMVDTCLLYLISVSKWQCVACLMVDGAILIV